MVTRVVATCWKATWLGREAPQMWQPKGIWGGASMLGEGAWREEGWLCGEGRGGGEEELWCSRKMWIWRLFMSW